MTESLLNCEQYCPTTGILLYVTDDNGTPKASSSYGECRSCGLEYSAARLQFVEEFSQPKWPVVYDGAICKDCIDEKIEESMVTNENGEDTPF